MRVPLQHVATAGVSPISVPVSGSDPVSGAFASAMQSLVLRVMPEKTVSGEVTPALTRDLAREGITGGTGLEIQTSANPTGEAQQSAPGLPIAAAPPSLPAASGTRNEAVGENPDVNAPVRALKGENLLPVGPFIAELVPIPARDAVKSGLPSTSAREFGVAKAHEKQNEHEKNAGPKDDAQGVPQGFEAMPPVSVTFPVTQPTGLDPIIVRDSASDPVKGVGSPAQRPRSLKSRLTPGGPVVTNALSESPQGAIAKSKNAELSLGSAPGADDLPIAEQGKPAERTRARFASSRVLKVGENTIQPAQPLAASAAVHSKPSHSDDSGELISASIAAHAGSEPPTAALSLERPEGTRAEPAAPLLIANGHSQVLVQDSVPMHEQQKSPEAHQPQEIASQVLQRLDAAVPAAPTRFHADARRLEVGVAAGSLGWLEVHATTGSSGRVDAMLHVQNDASAHVLAEHSAKIASFAHEHSVHLGQVSVGAGTGNGERRRDSQSTENGGRDRESAHHDEDGMPAESARQVYHAADRVTLISLRA